LRNVVETRIVQIIRRPKGAANFVAECGREFADSRRLIGQTGRGRRDIGSLGSVELWELVPTSGQVFPARCCTSLVVSPSAPIRNVPYTATS
jgi:hypothetical protein